MSLGIKLSFLTIVALLLLQQWFGIFGYGSLAKINPIASSAAVVDPCAGKRLCFVAVVAPWCPSCHATIPFLQSLRRRASQQADLGFQVIIAADELDNLRRMGSEIGEPYYMDNDGRSSSAVSGSAVPRWVVIDSTRRILKKGSGLPAVDDTHPGFSDYVSSKFGL